MNIKNAAFVSERRLHFFLISEIVVLWPDSEYTNPKIYFRQTLWSATTPLCYLKELLCKITQTVVPLRRFDS